MFQDGSKKGKNAGNSAVGEKQVDSSSDDDDEDDFVAPGREGASNIDHLNDHKHQGLQSADAVIGGEKISFDQEMSDKKKKKIAQREAKRKRDDMVSKMIKGTEVGLGDFADFMERLQK